MVKQDTFRRRLGHCWDTTKKISFPERSLVGAYPNFMHKSLKKSFFPGDSEGAKSLKIKKPSFSGNHVRRNSPIQSSMRYRLEGMFSKSVHVISLSKKLSNIFRTGDFPHRNFRGDLALVREFRFPVFHQKDSRRLWRSRRRQIQEPS